MLICWSKSPLLQWVARYPSSPLQPSDSFILVPPSFRHWRQTLPGAVYLRHWSCSQGRQGAEKNQAGATQRLFACAVLACFPAPVVAAGAGGAARKGAGILDVPNVNVDHVRMCADPCHSTHEHRNRGENASNTKLYVFCLLVESCWMLCGFWQNGLGHRVSRKYIGLIKVVQLGYRIWHPFRLNSWDGNHQFLMISQGKSALANAPSVFLNYYIPPTILCPAIFGYCKTLK